MKLFEIMTAPVHSIDSHGSIADAQSAMRRHRIRHLLVLNAGKVVGVVSANDLRGATGDAALDTVMSARPVCAAPTTTVREAANLLRGHNVGCLPVIDRGKPQGIVTISDVLALLGRGAERPVAKATRWTLRARGPRKTQPSADRSGLVYRR